MISEALKNVKQPDDIDIEEIQRHIEAQYALILPIPHSLLWGYRLKGRV